MPKKPKTRSIISVLIAVELLFFFVIIYYAFFSKRTSSIYEEWGKILQNNSPPYAEGLPKTEDAFLSSRTFHPSAMEDALKAESLVLNIVIDNAQARLAHKLFMQAENLRKVTSFHESIVSYEKAKKIFLELKAYKSIMACLIGMGDCYRTLDDQKNATKCFKKVLAYQSKKLSYYLEARAWRGLAQTYPDSPQAKFSLEKAYALFKLVNNNAGMASILKIYGDIDRHQGQAASAKQYYKKSIKLFRSIKDIFGEANGLRGLGHLFVSFGDYDRAKQYFQRALKIFDNMDQKRYSAKVLRGLGDIEALSNDYDQAAQYYDEALRLFTAYEDKRSRGEVLHGFGVLYRRKGDFNMALASLEKAASIFNQCQAKIWLDYTKHEKAFCLYKKGSYDKSIKLAHEILQETTNNKLMQGRICYLLARLEKAKGRYKESLSYIGKSLKNYQSIDNKKGIAFCRMFRSGVNFYYTNDFKAAMNDSEEAYKIFQTLGNDYQKSSILRRIADIQRFTDNYETSFNTYQKSLEYLTDKNPQKKSKIFFGMGSLEKLEGNWQKSLQYYNKAMAQAKKAGGGKALYRILMAIGSIYRSNNQPELARALLFKAYEGSRVEKDILGSIWSLKELGEMAYREGKIYEAKKMVLKSLSLMPNQPKGFFRGASLQLLSRILFFEGNFERALKTIKSAILNYAHLDAHFYQVKGLLRLTNFATILGLYDVAENNLNKAALLMNKVNQEAYTVMVHLRFGQLYYEKGDMEKALVYFEKVKTYLDTHSNDTLTYHYKIALAQFFYRMGNFEKSKTLLKEALSFTNLSHNTLHKIEAYRHLAYVLTRLQEFQEVEKILMELKKFSSQSVLLKGTIAGIEGRFFVQQCKFAKAIQKYQKALEIMRGQGLLKNTGIILCDLGDALMRVQKNQEAQKAYEGAIKLYEAPLTIYEQAYPIYKIGCLAIRRGDISLAEISLKKALKYASKMRNISLQVRILYYLSTISTEDKASYYKRKSDALLTFLSSIKKIDVEQFHQYMRGCCVGVGT